MMNRPLPCRHCGDLTQNHSEVCSNCWEYLRANPMRVFEHADSPRIIDTTELDASLERLARLRKELRRGP